MAEEQHPVDARRRLRLEMAGAAALAAAGVAATTVGAFAHVLQLAAPGAAGIVFGGAWLGNVLARADVRLFGRRAESGSEAPTEARS